METDANLPEPATTAEPSGPAYVVKNRIRPGDEAIHGWYRFVLGYPPHLVRQYLDALDADPERDWVLDPFCGTATTPVEARMLGFRTISVEANPICVLATRAKLAWAVDVDVVREQLAGTLLRACSYLSDVGLTPAPSQGWQALLFEDALSAPGHRSPGAEGDVFKPADLLPEEAAALIPSGFISPKPLMRVLAVRKAASAAPDGVVKDLLLLALAHVIVNTAGNVGFGPEVYRLPPKDDADVLGAFRSTVQRMAADLEAVQAKVPGPFPTALVVEDDARVLSGLGENPRAGVVITSPPYPNEKDYTRSTRLESVLLGFVRHKGDLRAVKDKLLRSNTRTVFAGDTDDRLAADVASVNLIAEEIERRRRMLGKTSGFERLYQRVTRLYFGGMYRHLVALLPFLRGGARCAYVVGDQMSYFRVHIRTAHVLADVATKAGYKVLGIDLWRTRRSTTTGEDLEENVLILRRP